METKEAIALVMMILASFQMRSVGPEKDGVYKTAKDFEQHHLTDSIIPTDKLHYLKDNWTDKIVIKSGNVKHVYAEGEIYAWQLKGKDFRYFDANRTFGPRGYFQIVDTSGLIIYAQVQPQERGGEKISYFYSTGYESPIKELSRKNLKYELKNREFVMALFSLKNISEHKAGCFTVNSLYKQFKDLPADI